MGQTLQERLRTMGVALPTCTEAADALDSRDAEIARLREALEFYGDARTYHAIAFMSDPPCGEFADDFSEDHGDPLYDRPMPGKTARSALTGDPS